jgi:mevalonate kinase
MKTITAQGQEMKKALEAGDLKTVGTIMTTNHRLLAEMEFSHEILDKMCKSALERGAWGAKVTGGGRGGYMISLTPGKELQDKIASAFDKEGYKVIKATIGGS